MSCIKKIKFKVEKVTIKNSLGLHYCRLYGAMTFGTTTLSILALKNEGRSKIILSLVKMTSCGYFLYFILGNWDKTYTYKLRRKWCLNIVSADYLARFEGVCVRLSALCLLYYSPEQGCLIEGEGSVQLNSLLR